jgi:hypothetical protein
LKWNNFSGAYLYLRYTSMIKTKMNHHHSIWNLYPLFTTIAAISVWYTNVMWQPQQQQFVCVYGWMAQQQHPMRRVHRTHSRTCSTLHKQQQPSRNSNKSKRLPQRYKVRMMMIRNIDLPDAVIFYGTETIIPSYVADESDEDAIQRFRSAMMNNDDETDTTVIQARTGLTRFIEECHTVRTAVIVLLNQDDETDDTTDHFGIEQQYVKGTNRYILDAILRDDISRPCHVFTQTVTPPNPSDVLSTDSPRLIVPQHCVVFTTTLPQTRIARAVGMRVISMNRNDPLADGVLMDYGDDADEDDDDDDSNKYVSINLSVDCIATPGSYWLNPPHPRDDNGNQITNPYDIMNEATTTSSVLVSSQSSMRIQHPSLPQSTKAYPIIDDDNSDNDENLRAILSDIAPLKRIP